MKDEFLNFTGPSWGEYSNASGRRGNGNGGNGNGGNGSIAPNTDYNALFAEMFYDAQGCIYEGTYIIAPMISEFLAQQGITESNTPFSVEEVAYYYEGMYLMGPSCEEYNDPNPPAPPQEEIIIPSAPHQEIMPSAPPEEQVLFNKDFLILNDLKFLSEIICIFFISVVPSARLELALRKRQGF